MQRLVVRHLIAAALCTLVGCSAPGEPEEPPSAPWQTSREAAAVPTDFVDAQVAGGISDATAMGFAPDGRLFVCEQGGRLRVIKNGALLATPFATLPVSSSGERGLLGVAFDPAFATNHYVYVYYTATAPTIHNRVSRFVANGDVGTGETVLLELDTLSGATNHNGGAMHFGADGKLYIGVGENANSANSQTLGNLLGKVLRINADGSIPTDNPFYAQASGRNRAIWALGLRNPFTFAVQPGTGKLHINDVGQNTWEEVNLGVKGGNYGWPTTEGDHNDGRFQRPIYVYDHAAGCAIAGGAFYNPAVAQFPSSYVNSYFFADLCGGWIRRLAPGATTATTFATNVNSPVDLAVGPDGALYYLARGSSEVRKISYAASGQAPTLTAQPQSRTVSAGSSATFSVSASGTAPLAYQWQRNGADLPGATSASYTLASASAADDGATFRVRVSNAFGAALSNSATLTVTSNHAPTASLTSPAAGATYAAGDVIGYAGTGSDTEDGALPGSAFTWRVDFHHDTHTHPFVPSTTGATSGSFTIPREGETAANVWYRIHLTVRDSAGLTASTFRDIKPRTAVLRLRTSPAGLTVLLDGQPRLTPVDVVSVVGMTRTLSADPIQTFGGEGFSFAAWSDGGARTHNVDTPAAGGLYTARSNVRGTGLVGEYFDGPNFSTPVVKRFDAQVSFDWGAGSPDTRIGPDTFSARWTGQLLAPVSGAYTFTTRSDDGVRLWVNGQLLVDNWTNHAATDNSGTLSLVANRRYDVKLEYYENTGSATVRLSWVPPGGSTPVAIPERFLRPGTLPGVNVELEAEAGVVTGPFTAENGALLQRIDTQGNVAGSGRAAYAFDVPAAGNYVVRAFVAGLSAGENSFLLNIDAEPVDVQMVWDVPVGTFSWKDASWRGNGTPSQSQFVPKLFSLSAGRHTLVLRGREPNTRIDRILIQSR